MYTNTQEQLITHFKVGRVYRRDTLLPFSKAIDRDLSTLVNEGVLGKAASGLYYKPEKSRFGKLQPEDQAMVKAFLRNDRFLLLDWSYYNTLGLGLTQLHNKIVVYNRKRHGLFILGNKQFDFRRSARGFPSKLTPEFLLVDLVNNLNELTEDSDFVKERVKQHMHRFNLSHLLKYAKQYGKIATYRFFAGMIQ